MIPVTVNPNRSMEGHINAMTAELAGIGRRFESEAEAVVNAAAKQVKASLTGNFTASMENPYDGKVVCRISGAAEGTLVEFTVEAAVKSQVLSFEVADVVAAIKAAADARRALPAPAVAALPAYAVDLKMVAGRREGDTLIFAMENPGFTFANWKLIAGVADLGTDDGRKVVAKRILASLKMWLASRGMEAGMGDQEAAFAVPVIQVIAEKKPEPRTPISIKASAAPVQPETAHMPVVTEAKPTFVGSLDPQDARFDAQLRPSIEAAVRDYARNTLRGSEVVVAGIDYAGLKSW